MSGLFSRRKKSEVATEQPVPQPPDVKTTQKPHSPRSSPKASVSMSSSSSNPAPQAQTSSSPRSPSQKSRRATIYDNLFYPVSSANPQKMTKADHVIIQAAKKRKLFTMTPENEHLDNRSDKNELEFLLDKYQSEFEQIVPSLCDALNAVIVSHTLSSRRKSVMSEENRFVSYDTSAVPDISLEDYLWRICDYTYISPTTLLMACIYIDRLILDGLILSHLNVFKLFFTSVRVASKVHELRSLSNKNFAVVGGVTTEQMNQLESLFMRDFKWKLWVEHDLFSQYCQRLMPPGEDFKLPPIGK